MDLGLKGLRALVTGATKGIGRRIAECFADEGTDVAFCARDAREVAETEKAPKAKGVRAFGTVLDVADGKALAEWVNAAAAKLGGLDIIVSNVSALAIGPGEEPWRKCFEVDVLGAVRLVDAAMPHLEKSKHPSIVTVSSVSGREIDFAAGSYGAMKAALIHYT
jgi:3-oxoacyl-[acyl-carrier protein] reductase